MKKNVFDSIITALITPLIKDKIDFQALKFLIDRQIDASIHGLIIGGCTGEGSTLRPEQYFSLLEFSAEHARNRIKIFAGMTVASTSSALYYIDKLTKLNIDGIMCTTPPYIKPEQEGLFLHCKAVHDMSNMPLMLYINPGRTSCDVSDESIIKIMNLKRFVAIKDSTVDITKPLRILTKINVTMLTGNDAMLLSYYANGGSGCVSVIANIFPKTCQKIDNLWKKGEVKEALVMQRELTPLYSALSAETNPIGIKYAAYKIGLCSKDIISPLTFAKSSTRSQIDFELQRLKLLENNV